MFGGYEKRIWHGRKEVLCTLTGMTSIDMIESNIQSMNDNQIFCSFVWYIEVLFLFFCPVHLIITRTGIVIYS